MFMYACVHVCLCVCVCVWGGPDLTMLSYIACICECVCWGVKIFKYSQWEKDAGDYGAGCDGV